MIFSIIPLAIILLFVVIAVIVAGKSPMTEGDDKMFKKIYVYLVLFATLMMSIGGTVGAFMAAADLVAPPAYYQSFEEYKNMRGDMKIKEGTGSSQSVSEAQLKQDYDSYLQNEQGRTKNRAMNSLIKSFGWIVIPLPVFLYFQRQSRKEA